MDLNQDQLQELSFQRKMLFREVYKRNIYQWLKDCAFTFDEHDEENPVKKFPIKPYTKEALSILVKDPISHWAKSRQVMMSWLAMAYVTHKSQFIPHRSVVVVSKKEKDAQEMVERAKFIYMHQPEWLKKLCPLDRKMRDMPFGSLFFENNSKLQGFPQGADQIRSYVPSIAVLDEAAIQDKYEETYGACVPCAKQIISISSAGAGFFQQLVELDNDQ